MNDYVAWINGSSIARGTLAEVERKARAHIASPEWQAYGLKDGGTFMRITRGPRQSFVKSVRITQDSERGYSKNGFPL